MRTKTRTTAGIKPGMVIRLDFSTREFCQVATVTRGPWANTRQIGFTDGASQWFHITTGWTVARGKSARNAATVRAAGLPQPTAMQSAFALLGGYATGVVSARV